MQRFLLGLSFWLAAALLGCRCGTASEPPEGMALIGGGSFRPAYSGAQPARTVAPFYLDSIQVTNAQFLEFVRGHPEWQRSKVSHEMADANYLKHWAGDLDLGPNAAQLAPVTWISWQAAKAYCESMGKRLPLQDEWEFAARADATRTDATGDPGFLHRILDWYSTPTTSTLGPALEGTLNVYGVRGLHGVVWEWVADFNTVPAAADQSRFCGGGAGPSGDAGDYAAYMRYAFRSSLKGNYCIGSLGFRGAKSVGDAPPVVAARAADSLYDLAGTWISAEGTKVSLASLRGRPCVLTLGFTQCQSTCPRILSDMQRIEKALGADADGISFVFLSIDPQHDTPAKMRRTLEERRMSAQRWRFLAAPDEVVRAAAVALDFRYQVIEGFFSHSNLIAVIDEQGHVVHREEALEADPSATVAAVEKVLGRRSVTKR
jgi:formylglycine-generating enzyme required for sulfatase activity/cytochrome oxidase Cu insertion factor (SCO1/SenC/PrrC family)